MSERNPVICPWCKNNGIESLMTKQRDSVGMELGDDYYYCPLCHSHSPHIHTVGGEWDIADKECYAAANRTPPNLPLTLPSLFELEEDDAVWVVSENGRIWAMSAEAACEWASEADTVLFFARKPTAADIEEARKARIDSTAQP